MNLAQTLKHIRAVIAAETGLPNGRGPLGLQTLSADAIAAIVEYAHLSGQQAGIAEARTLIAGTVAKHATLNQRHADASRNELATEIQAAEDVIDPRSAYASPRRAVGFIEFKPGEEPDRWDADWDGGVK